MALSPEQLQARIEEETDKEIPADVTEDFQRIIWGARNGKLSLYKQMCPLSGRVYYMLVLDGATHVRPLAVVPERITAGQMISNYDAWMDQSGASAEADPDWARSTGRKQ
jgi:hypothetical protein